MTEATPQAARPHVWTTKNGWEMPRWNDPRVPFAATLSLVTGRDVDEVFDYLNLESTPVEVQIQNPKNPGEILKTIYVEDGQFQPPGTPARVNQATDFSFAFNSISGSFSEFKGARP